MLLRFQAQRNFSATGDVTRFNTPGIDAGGQEPDRCPNRQPDDGGLDAIAVLIGTRAKKSPQSAGFLVASS